MAKRPQGVVEGFTLDRIERMIRYLRENRDKINESEKGKVTFDYKGSIVTARHENVQEKI